MLHERELGADEARHAQAVRAHVAARIAASGGWLSFEDYMDAVLYAPGLGYYSAGARKLGAGGDFTTAPEISPLFGACLARQCAEITARMDAPAILEIGAGTGRLAADLLARLAALDSLPARYAILEVSADLRERQRELLAARAASFIDRIEWLDAPPSEPYDGVVIANEVLDALPVARFRWHRTHVEELGVVLRGDDLDIRPRPAGSALVEACARLRAAGGDWEDGYESEYSPRLGPFTEAATRALRRGAALWVDYGLPRAQYYMPERRQGTLLGHFRQRAHADPLLHPGLSDLTAWVDFTLLAESARAAGFSVAGFATQSFVLASLEIGEEMRIMAAGDDDRFARLAGQARRLMMPGEMGERFKAMAWTRGLDAPLTGFSLQDLRHTL